MLEEMGPRFDRTKHGSLFLSVVIHRVVPHMDNMDRVVSYLTELGALHERQGVARQHLDLLGLAYCFAIRGIVQGAGVQGGLLHETTKAWMSLVLAICQGMKLGYSSNEADASTEVGPSSCPLMGRRDGGFSAPPWVRQVIFLSSGPRN